MKIPRTAADQSAPALRCISMKRSGSEAVQESIITAHKAMPSSTTPTAAWRFRIRSAMSAAQTPPALMPHRKAVSMVVYA